MEKKHLLAIVVIAIIAVGALFWKDASLPIGKAPITSYDECVAAGNMVQESYPAVCVTVDGQRFIQEIADLPDVTTPEEDIIVIEKPAADATVTSPLTVTGKARGNWYFEASFPVKLLDANDDVIASGVAQAKGDWMTEDYVPFSVTLTFKKQTKGSSGTLVLMKDNPSGLPENEDARTLSVTF